MISNVEIYLSSLFCYVLHSSLNKTIDISVKVLLLKNLEKEGVTRNALNWHDDKRVNILLISVETLLNSLEVESKV